MRQQLAIPVVKNIIEGKGTDEYIIYVLKKKKSEGGEPDLPEQKYIGFVTNGDYVDPEEYSKRWMPHD